TLTQSRRRLTLPRRSVLHAMAGAHGKYFGTKIYSTHPKHGAHFLFALYSAADARPLALFEANALGQIRTGAASGYATRLLARVGASVVGVIGSGFQARSQIEAMRCVCPGCSVRVWSRSAENRVRCAVEMGVSAVDSAEEAVRGADIVVTATNSKAPVLESDWVGPGTHINAMGSNQPTRREIPAELVMRADVIAVDSIEQASLESGDLIFALDNAGWSRVVELPASRPSPEAITLFKSNGIGAEDVAVAGYVYERSGYS
ncbi:MAG: ornithine cyclodeaminase family protein, partial [Bryobacteraceae bacterium]